MRPHRITFDLIKEVVHAGTYRRCDTLFSGSKEMAKEYIKMGYYIGVGGVARLKMQEILKEVVESIHLSGF